PALAIQLHAILLEAQFAELLVKLAVSQGFFIRHAKYPSACDCESPRYAAVSAAGSTGASARPAPADGGRAVARLSLSAPAAELLRGPAHQASTPRPDARRTG